MRETLASSLITVEGQEEWKHGEGISSGSRRGWREAIAWFVQYLKQSKPAPVGN